MFSPLAHQQNPKGRDLTLYLNKDPLMQYIRVSAAAQVYFKEVSDLTLDEIAIIAGLPRHPPMLNPIRSPERAFARRNVVLGRMLETGKITRPSMTKPPRCRSRPVFTVPKLR